MIAVMNSPNFSQIQQQTSSILNLVTKSIEGSFGSEIVNGELEMTAQNASGDIQFHNVWFKYSQSDEDDHWILRNFNLTIRAGECLGVIGESGSGKSTLTTLIYRFYDPQQGYITIDGIDIRNFTLASLRSQFGIVHQEPILFNDTILSNIVYGRSHANVIEIVEAANIANACGFIEKLSVDPSEDDQNSDEADPRLNDLPKGYGHICGTRGSKLSGGQKQRIAIARAIIRNPKVLILDEATSALDERSQKVVQKTLDIVTKRCTSIVIAHRLTTLSKCDRIIKIVNGCII